MNATEGIIAPPVDTITHGLAGSVLARAFAERPGARAAFALGLVAAMLPDFDFLFFADRLEYLRGHRGWTHSFLVMPFLALAVALVAKRWARGARLATLWLFAAIGVTSHILFDWITSFGTMFWTPLSRERYALDWVFLLDPIFTAIVAVTLALSIIWKAKQRRIELAGTAVLAAYLAFCAMAHALALEAWKQIDEPPPGSKVAVLPQFLSPFRWLGLTETEAEVRAAFFDIGPFARGVANPAPPTSWGEVLQSLSDFYPDPARADLRSFPRPPQSAVLEAARALPDWQVYRDFARFPLETVYANRDGGSTVIVQDLRFLPWFAGPWESDRGWRFRRRPFVYRVRFDSGLRAIDRGFVGLGRFR